MPFCIQLLGLLVLMGIAYLLQDFRLCPKRVYESSSLN